MYMWYCYSNLLGHNFSVSPQTTLTNVGKYIFFFGINVRAIVKAKHCIGGG